MRSLSWQSKFLCPLCGFHPCLFCSGDTYLSSWVLEFWWYLVCFRFMGRLSLGRGSLQGVRWTLQWDQSLFSCGPQGDSSARLELVSHTRKCWNPSNGDMCALFRRFSQLETWSATHFCGLQLGMNPWHSIEDGTILSTCTCLNHVWHLICLAILSLQCTSL